MEEKKNTIINLIKEVDNPDIINYLLDFAKDFIAAFNSQKSSKLIVVALVSFCLIMILFL